MAVIHPSQPSWRFDEGGDIITGTETHSGRWRGLHAMGTDATLAAGTVSVDLNGDLTGLVVPAGAILHGRFDQIQLSAGSCVMYR